MYRNQMMNFIFDGIDVGENEVHLFFKPYCLTGKVEIIMQDEWCFILEWFRAASFCAMLLKVFNFLIPLTESNCLILPEGLVSNKGGSGEVAVIVLH